MSKEELEAKKWKEQMFAAKYVVAPMVDQSELPFRLLCRKYGANLCYTPMFNANIFVKDHKYRRDNLVTCQYDRPLIVQFCGNNANIFLEAARMAVPYCDAIDLNIGCPQSIARRGHYGAFLEEEWDLLFSIINLASKELEVPITCKIRVFPEIEKTVRYAKMLESAGCQLIAVHGRTKEQKGPFTGLASWDHIKAIKENVNVPVFANGNIQSLADVENCLKATGVNGVMSAEGILHNPALFTGIHYPVWTIAKEYLKLTEQYPCTFSYIRGHLFKIFHHLLQMEENIPWRDCLAKANTMNHLHKLVSEIEAKYAMNESQDCMSATLPVPPYLCQPYFRPPPAVSLIDSSKNSSDTDMLCKQRQFGEENDEIETQAAKCALRKERKLKKLQKKIDCPRKKSKPSICESCPNPKGQKCDYNLCRACCRKKVFSEVLDCIGHGLLLKNKQLKKAKQIVV
ncbi:tRNA-dihydrouridine(16/17) synthase-like [NAD(P)(+)] [Dinothrombium tinctorium]|uniref:tRNA-dihydrouridine(16/17) synthase [NAD(P)(+)] n=1 Tax=Dinothrombium tinctorium TaxID=1965070 RepID=A0A443RI26_9ACAR|nr:tRNA-dihydrouridine(16/17) synthase-like [NAD(P)(+)] [Dinothrombium tinctorium]